MNETYAYEIRSAIQNYKVIYVGNEHGFSFSGIPFGSDQYIIFKLQENLDKTREVTANKSVDYTPHRSSFNDQLVKFLNEKKTLLRYGTCCTTLQLLNSTFKLCSNCQ